MCDISESLAQAVQSLIERNTMKERLGLSHASPEMLELADKNIAEGKAKLNQALDRHIKRERKLVGRKIMEALSGEEPCKN